jgi:hypothetical protein
VKLSKEFCQEGSILSGNGEHPEVTLHFGNTHFGPGNLALTTVASPQEGSRPLINSIDDTRREEADTHSMRQHSSDNRVDKEEEAANGKGAASPTSQAHVTLGDDRVKVSEVKFVGR